MATFNGHRSWNAWNVSLWINNDEQLYTLAQHYVKTSRTLDDAARGMLRNLEGQRTPDGAAFNYTCIREALRGFKG